ncbi:FixH family protein [Weizmannia acidilactici]|nr:FixH family protein [Weizmannia acidilactici]
MGRGWRTALLAVALAIALAACGKQQETATVKPVQVRLVVPKQVEADASIPLKAVVTQGKEKVNDADEVMFEIWRDGEEKNSQMLKAHNGKNGIYTAKMQIKRAGTYTVQVHVTARNMHVMPKTKIAVK